MEVVEITQMISTVGFPVACCIFIIFTNNKTIEKLRETVNNNTKVMVKLCTKLGVDIDIDIDD